jgi:hypothetical protein
MSHASKVLAGTSKPASNDRDPLQPSYSFAVDTRFHFLRRVALDYARYGYVRWAMREIPHTKDPFEVDQKLIKHYSITQTWTTRSRRKKKGLANVVMVRYHHTFVLLATEGKHPAFDRIVSFDIRTSPIHFRSYSIGLKGNKPCVKVRRRVWKKVQEYFHQIALRPKKIVEAQFNQLPFYGYFPSVVHQKRLLLKEINVLRKHARLAPIQGRFHFEARKRETDSSISSRIGDLTCPRVKPFLMICGH